MRGRESHVAGVGIAVGALLIALLAATTARAYESQPPGYVEGWEANPPALPSPTSPSGATPAVAAEAHSGAPRVERVPVVRYDRPAGMTVRIYVAGGYCIGEPPPEIQRVEIREHPIPGRARVAAVITAALRWPAPLEGAEVPPPDGEGPTEPVRVCNGLEHPLYERITFGHRPDEMVLLDGSTSPPRRIPAAPGSNSHRGRPMVPSAEDRGPRSGCDRPGSSTLQQTSQIRIFALKEKSVQLPNPDRHAIRGQPVFGCLESTGIPRLLDLPEAGGEKHALWVEVDTAALAVSAPLVAYAFTQYYLDTHETWIRARNLRTGSMIRDCLAGGDIAPGSLPNISEIVVTSKGAVAWSAEASEGNVVWACDRSGPHPLDKGEGVQLGSLTLEHGVVHWLDDGSEREAVLG